MVEGPRMALGFCTVKVGLGESTVRITHAGPVRHELPQRSKRLVQLLVAHRLEGIAVRYLVFAGHQQSEALEICGRLRASRLGGMHPTQFVENKKEKRKGPQKFLS